jgi:signal transduction histidine kinase
MQQLLESSNHGLGLAIVKAIALMHGGDVFTQ